MRLALTRLAPLPLALFAHAAMAAGEFHFAEAKIGDFEVIATTEYKWEGDDPHILNIRCEGTSADFLFVVERDGTLHLIPSFLGFPDEDGDRATITALGDILWLYVDGRPFELRRISSPDSKFSNHTYPPDPHAGQPILPVWRGHIAVRVSNSGPLMNLSRINDEIVAAKKLEWGFKSRNWKDIDRSLRENQLPEGWETRRYPIDNSHLGEAIDWCTRQVASDAAEHFPDELK